MSRRRTIAVGAGIAAAGAALGRRRTSRVPTDPLDPDAIRAETAAERTAEIIGREKITRADIANTYASAIATSVDPLLHGRTYFPRMLDDIAAATDHVHLLIYGYKPGDIGETFLTALADKVAAGVEVRLAVDAIGSEVDFGSKDLYRRLREAGVQIVAHDGIMVVRSEALGSRKFQMHGRDLLHFDHRKMMVVDGKVGYVGGSGIEDHFNDERFYDVMVRVEGPIVAQLAALFLMSWRYNGGSSPGRPRAHSLLSGRDTPGRRRRSAASPRDGPLERAGNRTSSDQRHHRAGPRGRCRESSTSSTRTSRTGRSSKASTPQRCAA